MAYRIGNYVQSGELLNTRNNSVLGWLEFGPDNGVRLELTGNLTQALKGKHLRFTVPNENAPEGSDASAVDSLSGLEHRQIGVIGDVVLRSISVPDLPIDEFLNLDSQRQRAHLVDKPCLVIEWYGQNGRVVAEIVSPNIEYVDNADEPLADGLVFDAERAEMPDDFAHDLGLTSDGEDEEDDADPYGLFGSDLDQTVADSLGPLPDPAESDNPIVDDATQAMYLQWDEIFEGSKDEPISYLFESPLKLPPPERVQTDEEAIPLVRTILAQLALLSVALDVCEHFTPVRTYHLLMNEVLTTARVHPDLPASGMVQHYSTSDYCEECEAEFDAEYEDSGLFPDDTLDDDQVTDADDNPPMDEA